MQCYDFDHFNTIAVSFHFFFQILMLFTFEEMPSIGSNYNYTKCAVPLVEWKFFTNINTCRNTNRTFSLRDIWWSVYRHTHIYICVCVCECMCVFYISSTLLKIRHLWKVKKFSLLHRFLFFTSSIKQCSWEVKLWYKSNLKIEI